MGEGRFLIIFVNFFNNDKKIVKIFEKYLGWEKL